MTPLPHRFTSRLQLDEYIRCLRNIRVGDEVEYYVDGAGWHSQVPTDYIRRAEVIVACKDPEVSIPNWPIIWTRWNNDPSTKFPLIVLGSNSDLFSTHRQWISGIQDLITKSNTKHSRSQHLLCFVLLVKRVFHK